MIKTWFLFHIFIVHHNETASPIQKKGKKKTTLCLGKITNLNVQPDP